MLQAKTSFRTMRGEGKREGSRNKSAILKLFCRVQEFLRGSFLKNSLVLAITKIIFVPISILRLWENIILKCNSLYSFTSMFHHELHFVPVHLFASAIKDHSRINIST